MTTQQKKKKNGGQRYDWHLLKTEYVTTDISLKKLAEKHGIRSRTVEDRCAKEGWVALRKKHKEKVTSRATNKAATKQANALAKELESVDLISDVIRESLNDLKQFNKHLVQNEYVADGGNIVRVTEQQEFDVIDTRRLKELASSLKLVEEMKRSMLSILTMEQKNRELRERRKLELEEERLELQKSQLDMNKPDKDIKIVIEGFEDDWTN